MNDAASFVKAIIAGNWDAAGVFADWLEEHGDPRGKLLRRRWKMWQKDRAEESARCQERNGRAWYLGGLPFAADIVFRDYVKRKFFNEWCDATAEEFGNSQAYKDS